MEIRKRNWTLGKVDNFLDMLGKLENQQYKQRERIREIGELFREVGTLETDFPNSPIVEKIVWIELGKLGQLNSMV